MRQRDSDRLDPDLKLIVDSSGSAVLVKDEDGYCRHANRAAEALFGYGASQLNGVHMTDLGPADPALIWREYERLKLEKVWVGQYPVRRRDGSIVQVKANAFTTVEPDGATVCLEFLYPVNPGALPARRTSQSPFPLELTTRELSLLQLMVEGFSNEQLAVLLGTGTRPVSHYLGAILKKMNASSRTEACVMAIKAHLVF